MHKSFWIRQFKNRLTKLRGCRHERRQRRRSGASRSETLETRALLSAAPILTANGGFTVNEAATHTISPSELQATDSDTAAGQLEFRLTATPGNGVLQLSGSSLSVGDTFTQADIDSGQIQYVHNGSETTSDVFGIRLSDGISPHANTRLNVDSLGSQATGGASTQVSVSGDGRFVAFTSFATDLVAGDTNNASDVFVHDRVTGAVTRVSVDSLGNQGNGNSNNASISADGRYVTFASAASNLATPDVDTAPDVFIHDRQTGQTTQVLRFNGQEITGSAFGATISDDGSLIAFQSNGGAVVAGDTNGASDVFVFNRVSQAVTRVSVDSSGAESNGASAEASISGNGRYVAFSSSATNLVPGDTNGVADIFVHDLLTGSTSRVSVSSGGAEANGASGGFSGIHISDDGQIVTFHSTASNLVSGDTNGVNDVFRHDRQTGVTTRISVSSTGAEADNLSRVTGISGDGRFIAFKSLATNLVTDDTGFWDIFRHDSTTGETLRVSVGDNGEQANGHSGDAVISDDGRFVFFNNFADNLVAGDTNGESDILVRDMGVVFDQVDVSVTSVNDAPTVANPLADLTFDEDSRFSDTFDLSTVFADPDSTLTYTVTRSGFPANGILGATITGATLELNYGVDRAGSGTVTVTADDGVSSVSDEFTVTINPVNEAPNAGFVPGIADITVNEDASDAVVNLQEAVFDPDTIYDSGLFPTYSVVSSNPSLATLTLSNQPTNAGPPTNSLLTIDFAPNATGTATITVTADDSEFSDSATFDVIVNAVNDAPAVASPLPDLTVNEDAANEVIDLAGVFDDVDGDTLTLTAVSSDGSVVGASLSGTTLTLSFPANANGAANVTVTADDGSLTVSDTFSVTVNAVNDAPTVVNPLPDLTVSEDAANEVIDVSNVFDDVDGDTLVLTAVSSDGSIVGASLSGTTLTLSFPANANGAANVTVTADDGSLTVSDTFSVTVNAVNDAPTLANPLPDLTVSEDAANEIIDVSNVFDDVDGDTLTLTAVSSDGSVVGASLSGTTLTLSFPADANGAANVTVTADDGSLTVSDTFSVTVNAINDAPTVASPLPDLTVSEDAANEVIDLSGVFDDVDGDTLTLTAVSSDGSVVGASLSGTTLTLSFPANANGAANVTVTADDGSLTVSDTFSVTVNAVNDAPTVANPLPDLTVNEGAANEIVDLSNVFDDVDGDTLTLTAVSSDGSVVGASLSGTTLTLSFPADANGTANVTVTADDGSLTVSDTFSVTVNAVNDAPTVANPLPDLTVSEDAANEIIDVSNVFDDVDGDTLTLTAVSSDGSVVGASLSGTTLTLSFPADANGTANVTVTADDGSLTVSDTFSVTVNAVNDAPTVANPLPDLTVSEDAANEIIDVSNVFDDVDGDTLTLTAVSSDGSVVGASLSGTTLTLSFPANANGAANVTVTADDGSLTVSDTFSVTVNAVNDAPTVANPLPDLTVNEDGANEIVDLSNVFDDVDGDTLTLTAVSSDGSVVGASLSGTTLTLNFPANANGTANVTVTADDGSLTVSDTFSVTVNAVNDAPTVANPLPDLTVSEGTPNEVIDLSNVFDDVDGDTLTLTAVSSDGSVVGASLSGTTLTLSFPANANGTANVTVTADDGSLTVSDTFSVTVNAVNDAPTVANPLPDLTVSEDAANEVIDLSNVFDDVDGDTLTLTAVSSDGSVVGASLSGTTLTLSFPANANGAANVTVTADDGSLTVSDTFSVTVNAVNDAPTVASPLQNLTVSEDAANEVIDLSGVFDDIDGDTLALTAVSSDGSVVGASLSGTTLTLNFPANTNGTANVTVTADDGSLTVSDTFSVTVNAVNDAPTVANPLPDLTVSEGTPNEVIDLSNVFDDVDGDTLTLTAVSSDGSVVGASLSGTTLTLSFPANANGAANVTVTADDGSLTVSDTFSVTVNAVNDAPTVASPLPDLTVSEDASNEVIDLSNVFDDVDGDTLTLTAVSSDGSVVGASLSGTTLTLSFPANANGTANVTVTADDGSLTVSDTFSVTVNAVNDAPTVANPLPDLTVNEDAPNEIVDLSNVFDDVDGDTLALTAVSSDGSVVGASLSGTTLTLSFPANANGAANITVTADDGSLTVSDTFSVTVNAVNDAPTVANPLPDLTVNEDAANEIIEVSNVFDDVDGDTLALTAVSSDGSVVGASLSGTTLTLSFPANANGAANITVTADDGSLTVSDTFSVTVNAVNDAPTVANPLPDLTVSEGTPNEVIDVSNVFDDVDGATLTLTAVSSDGSVVGASLSGTTLTLSFPANANGAANVTVTADDGSLTVSDTFSVTVNAINDAPTVVNPLPDLTVSEDAANEIIDLSGVFDDVDGDTLTLTAVSSDGSVVGASLSGTTLTLSFPANANGAANITVTADDGSLTVSDTFSVTVNAINDAPTVASPLPDLTVSEDASNEVIDLSNVFDDVDGDTLTLTAVSSDGSVVGASLSGTTLTLSFPANANGAANITVTADDGSLTVSDTFSVTVNAINDAPTVANPLPDLTVSEDASNEVIDLSNVFDDVDGDTLTLTAVSSDGSVVGASLSGTTLTLSFPANANGTANVTVTADDGSLTVSDTFSVTVNAVNDAPTVANPLPDLTVNEDAPNEVIDLSSVFDDVDGDTLALTAVSSDGSVVGASLSGTTLTLSFPANANGAANITVTADDGSLTVSDTFNVTVNAVNDAPTVATPLPDLTVNEDAPNEVIDLSSVFDDVDGDTLALTAVSSDGSVVGASLSGTTLTLSFPANANGAANITVTADDGSLTVSDTFNVTVNAVNDAPTVVNPLPDLTVNEDAANEIVDLSNVFDDVDGDTLTLTAVSSDGSVVGASLSGTTLTLSFPANANGTANVTVTADDGSLTASETFSVTVNAINDAPTVANPLPDLTVNEDAPNEVIDLSNVFDDVDGDTLTLTAVSSDGSVVGASLSGTTLTLSFLADGSASITVTATDAAGDSVSDNFVVTVSEATAGPDPGVDLVGDKLVVTGTDGNDQIYVTRSRGKYYIFTNIDGFEFTRISAVGINEIHVDGGDGHDQILMSCRISVPTTLLGGAGNDFIHGGHGADSIHGGDGNDWIYAGSGNDHIHGGRGNDRIYASQGHDIAYGGDGNDKIFGGSGNDILLGQRGDDIMSGGSGRDILIGGEGADRMSGGKGSDLLISGDTNFDGDEATLEAMRDLWTSGGSRVARRNAILDLGLEVTHDDDVDIAWGNWGHDWLNLDAIDRGC